MKVSVLLLAASSCVCAASAAHAGHVTAAPRITTTAGLNGAVIVTLASTTSGARVYYTVDGSAPTARSTPYETPFLIWSNRTVRAIAQAPGEPVSRETARRFRLNIRSGTLVWSNEFNAVALAPGGSRPDPQLWNYTTGADTNASVGILCAYGSDAAPCNPAFPNSYLGEDGDLHIVAQQPSRGVFTSARVDTRGRFSFQYGRLEARIWVPEGQGIWPAFWLLGDNVDAVGWPACGEIDIMERVNKPGMPPPGMDPSLSPPPGTSDWNKGSLHGTGFTGNAIGTLYYFKGGVTAAGWHTYGIIKTPDKIEFYIDDPAHPYATLTPRSIDSLPGAVWPFDNGQSFYPILNIAVGGDWPGSPDSSSHFPATMRVDYVRLYSN
ncbi:MAG TPA: family 16 glycosylhydrolase [Steroidobacteraceae bacterium]